MISTSKLSAVVYVVIVGAVCTATLAQGVVGAKQISGRESPDAISPSLLMVSFFSELISLQQQQPDEERGVDKLRQVLRSDRETARAMLNFMQSAFQEMKNKAIQETDARLCRRSADIRTAASLAEALRDIRATSEASRAEIARSAAAQFGEERMATLETYLVRERLPYVAVSSIDFDVALASADISDVVRRMCPDLRIGLSP